MICKYKYNIRAPVSMDFINWLRKSVKMLDETRILYFTPNPFVKFNDLCALM